MSGLCIGMAISVLDSSGTNIALPSLETTSSGRNLTLVTHWAIVRWRPRQAHTWARACGPIRIFRTIWREAVYFRSIKGLAQHARSADGS